MIELSDLPTMKYGRWTILRRSPPDKNRRHCNVLVRCECGAKRVTNLYAVLAGRSQSCGCWMREKPITHGLSHTRLYQNCWGAKNRCENQKGNGFANYGGRGIQFKFRDAGTAAQWIERNLGPRPSVVHSIDRIDNNSHYEAGNLRWATKSQQQRNKRPFRTHLFQYSTEELLLELARRKK